MTPCTKQARLPVCIDYAKGGVEEAWGGTASSARCQACTMSGGRELLITWMAACMSSSSCFACAAAAVLAWASPGVGPTAGSAGSPTTTLDHPLGPVQTWVFSHATGYANTAKDVSLQRMKLRLLSHLPLRARKSESIALSIKLQDLTRKQLPAVYTTRGYRTSRQILLRLACGLRAQHGHEAVKVDICSCVARLHRHSHCRLHAWTDLQMVSHVTLEHGWWFRCEM